jgi:septum formation protein
VTLAPRIYLASRSPRRRELLAQIGVDFELVSASVDESVRPGENPADFVNRLALAKAAAGIAALDGQPAWPVLAADTDVVVDGEILGKPASQEECLEMLAKLSDRAHEVYSGVAVSDGQRALFALSISRVHMRAITPGEAQAYWLTGEPADKAGAYGIQGHGAMFIRHLEGSYSGVMGLPLFETAALLQNFGIDCLAAAAADEERTHS